MGSTISIQAEVDDSLSAEMFYKVEKCFRDIEKIASRFDVNSELSFVNKNLGYTVEVSEDLCSLLKDAYYAYQVTGGKFDPRILKTLSNIGYANTFLDNQWKDVKVKPLIIREDWKPIIDDAKVYVGNEPIDLGGIGKSYTVWKSGQIVAGYSENFFVNAGGDIIFAGHAPEAAEWTVGVDNPYVEVSGSPLAILGLEDKSVATSSIAKHSWVTADGRRMHHIINPKTGLPADGGAVAVTVVHDDIIAAEIWSKTLFLEPVDEIAEFTESLKMPVLWFTNDNKMHYNEYMKPFVRWTI